MWFILALSAAAALIVPVYLTITALRRPSESGLTLNYDPAKHSPEQIKRGMESYWKKMAWEQSEFLLGDIGGDEARAFAEQSVVSIEVLSVESHDGDRSTFLVRTPTEDPDAPSEVTLVQCVFRNGLMGVQRLYRSSVAKRIVCSGRHWRAGYAPDRLEGASLESGQWEEAVAPPPANIGHSLNGTPDPDSSWLEMVVLLLPETGLANSVRLRVRITAQVCGEERYVYFPLQISTAPDLNGRIHHLWESAAIGHEDPKFPDSLHGITLKREKSVEGFIYFRPGDDTNVDVPQQPVTALWYGPRLLELPIDITCDS